jgi:O-antigen ligase
VIGHGWIHWGTSWASVQNIYLQTLVETGIIGGSLLVYVMATCARRGMRIIRASRRARGTRDLAFLAAAVTVAVFINGAAESSTLMGTSLNALLLGFGVGLIDRVPEFARQDSRRSTPHGAARSSFRIVARGPARVNA